MLDLEKCIAEIEFRFPGVASNPATSEEWQTLKAHCTQPTDVQQLKEDICPECDGDGEVSWDIAKVKCSACNGTGIRSSI